MVTNDISKLKKTCMFGQNLKSGRIIALASDNETQNDRTRSFLLDTHKNP